MSKKQDRTLLMCARISENFNPIKGTTIEVCEKCQHKVWHSPSSKELNFKEIEILCDHCVKEVVQKADPEFTQVVPLGDQQVEEITNHLYGED